MKNLNTWPRFLGEPARFNVRSWRRTTLESVGPELESTLGLHFVHEVEENEPLWTCATPASDTRLRCWTSDVPGLYVFHFVGSSPLPPGKDIRPHGEVISDAVAAQLLAAGHDWYVPHYTEYHEEGGVLGDDILDASVLVSLLSPPWLASLTPEERDAGAKLIEKIASAWLSAAKRTPDPGSDVRRRKLELLREYAEPSSRLRVLAAHAVKDQGSS